MLAAALGLVGVSRGRPTQSQSRAKPWSDCCVLPPCCAWIRHFQGVANSRGMLCIMAADRILRLPEVLLVSGHSRSSLYRAIRAGRFPPPVGVGDRARGWRDSEVQAWIRDLEPVEIGPDAGEDGDLPPEP